MALEVRLSGGESDIDIGEAKITFCSPLSCFYIPPFSQICAEIPSGTTILGRQTRELKLNDQSISRRHASIVYNEKTASVTLISVGERLMEMDGCVMSDVFVLLYAVGVRQDICRKSREAAATSQTE
jgi:hypothetical protein